MGKQNDPVALTILMRDHAALTGIFTWVGILAAAVWFVFVQKTPMFAEHPGMVAGGVVLATLICGGVVYWRVAFVQRLMNSGVKITGEVLEISKDDEETWHLIYSYEFEGATYEGTFSSASHPGTMKGKSIILRVDPQDPARSIVSSIPVRPRGK